MAYLQIITRTFGKRPTMLARNQASLAALSDPDWEQTLVIDEIGRGCDWANMNLANVPATGQYVWVLDDDDVCVYPGLVGALKSLPASDLIMTRALHADFGTLPHDANWGERPVLGDIGFSNFIVRHDIWEQYRPMFERWNVYWADFCFIDHLFRCGVRPYWLDVTVAHYPQRSVGSAE